VQFLDAECSYPMETVVWFQEQSATAFLPSHNDVSNYRQNLWKDLRFPSTAVTKPSMAVLRWIGRRRLEPTKPKNELLWLSIGP
jgi:hypothetical protein